jgi:hypothetical protein
MHFVPQSGRVTADSLLIVSSHHFAKFSQSYPRLVRLSIPLNQELKILNLKMHAASVAAIVVKKVFCSHHPTALVINDFEQPEVVQPVLRQPLL